MAFVQTEFTDEGDVTYGTEWYLYLAHRIAEHPPNLYTFVCDMIESTNLQTSLSLYRSLAKTHEYYYNADGHNITNLVNRRIYHSPSVSLEGGKNYS